MTAHRAVVDTLNALLRAEQASPFRFAAVGSLYLGRAGTELRQALAYVAAADARRAGMLWEMVERWGGDPVCGRPHPAEQHLAFLSAQFLLPKLFAAKETVRQQYRDAIGLSPTGPPTLMATLKTHLSEHAAEMRVLREAADAASSRP
jgi:hypothetical protein